MSTIEQTSTLTIKQRVPPTKKTHSKELLKRLPFLHKTSNSSDNVRKETPAELISSKPVKNQSSNDTISSDRTAPSVPKLNMRALNTSNQETQESGDSAPKPNQRAVAYNFPSSFPVMETSKNVINDEDKFDMCSERSMSIESDSTHESSADSQ